MIGEHMKQRTLTLRQIYKEGEAFLAEKQVPDAHLDAWLLLSYVTGIDKAAYYGNPEQEVPPEDAQRYFACIEARGRRVPLQHITGEQEFMGFPFYVDENVLIPRQDTEILVCEALKILEPGMRILDLCTGSGCILISLLKMSRERLHMEDITGVGADISEAALAVAERNAKALEVRAEFRQGNLFDNIEGKFDLAISNPPYIPTRCIDALQDEVRLYDPRIALDGREDGLYFYREIVRGSAGHIKDGGRLMFEIGQDQKDPVSCLMREAGYEEIQVKKDLAGLDRAITGIYSKKSGTKGAL